MSPSSTPAAPVRHRDRRTGEVVEEPIFAEATLRWLYEAPLGRITFRWLLNNKLFCALYGMRMDAPWSRRLIAPFISRFAIDMAEAERPAEAYRHFNDFFTRRLRPGARRWPTEPGRLGSPGDGKLLVYPRLAADTRLPIKGTACSPAGLLASDEEAAAFAGGAALVLRLAPPDYHRFHFPDGGTVGPTRDVPGGYDSVNPIALARVPDVFCRNKRAVTYLDSDHFGRVAIVEVGAITIGAIVQTCRPGRVARGDEKGLFRYGGSTVVLLFEPGRIGFDADLVAEAEAGLEVRVQAGDGIGRSLA
ncbi:MAG: phosphatidylserine decarboxylase [Candidatus Sericytochromatia bacterium]|nr:phosphatidylserine decarboxylase [Candidatus Sericytochromatia bacterium]